MSRHHAVIIHCGGGYVINDAGSANGITVQGDRIDGSAAVADGDLIGIGTGEFTFEIDDRTG